MWFMLSLFGRFKAFFSSGLFALSRHEWVHAKVRYWCAGNGWSVEVEPNDMGIFGSQWIYTLKNKEALRAPAMCAQWCDESSLTIRQNWSDFLDFMKWVVTEGSKPPTITEG